MGDEEPVLEPVFDWDRLSKGWQACLESAWEACREGTTPIGAAVTDARGRVLATGRNHIYDGNKKLNDSTRNVLAHAELAALQQIRASQEDRHTYILYTSMEPCPLCLGAFYMSGLRELHYAARDSYAGSTDLIGKTGYMRRKPIRVHPPENPLLETVLIGLHTSFSLRKGDISLVVLEAWEETLPRGVQLGRVLFDSGSLGELTAEEADAREAFTRLGSLAVNLG